MLTTRISRLLSNGNFTFARLNSELFMRPSFIKTFLFYYECILWNWTKIYYRMIHLSDINEVCIILHMRFQIAYILFSCVHSNCEVKAVNRIAFISDQVSCDSFKYRKIREWYSSSQNISISSRSSARVFWILRVLMSP